jgi:hypothetical protein
MKPGERVKPRGVDEDAAEYDTGTIISIGDGIAVVQWDVSGDTYTEPLNELEKHEG